ncbi:MULTISPECIES: TrkA C-terminal domain-containing protein [unclassified Caballeronia]|uniref:aspartate:alanine exchanger family transporter n=1 Tax=unclassified Caballeronia TaxID=2646786 RepID=UPI002855411C|nr:MULTISPECIES: TrkA C-terminal domain-containing protein [unclassified Caballeronia]MDR5749662.1 TrkA C-terminal domain-containing protein [Caballeronia sp. LZ024]MDR5843209.1 TrkA C-terminal domain-containing protein [Caballeronia sp. LZ031]
MEFVRTLLEQQPLMAVFLTIAIGYLVGEINIKGFSLGVGAVLFVALGVGWFAPKAAPAPMIGTLGLALFLYTVGVQYGKQFFLGLTSANGRRANLIALVGVLVAGVASIVIQHAMNLRLGYALGLFAGSGTSTAALQATIATLNNDDAAVGYSVSYPFGVAGPILLLYLAFMLKKPKIDMAAGAGLEYVEIALANPALFGKTLGDVTPLLPADVQIIARRSAHHNEPATPAIVIGENDVLLAVGPSRATLERAREVLGVAAPGRVIRDRSDLDYIRIFASRATVVGRPLGDLQLPGDKASIVAQVRRGDTDILPSAELVLEFGDRIGLLACRSDFPALRKYFGDSIKGTAEFSYISIGLGMALGFLLGAVQIPLPGIGKLALGLSGVLIVALVLGRLRRTGGMNWTIPLSANLVMRNLGLTLFLAQVGMASGPKFAATVTETGLLMLGLGAIVLLALAVPVLVLGLVVYRMPFDEVAGIVAGACGNPAILAFANKLGPTERPDIGYAMIFPGMTIVKILFVDIVGALM